MKLVSGTLLMGLSLISLTINEVVKNIGGIVSALGGSTTSPWRGTGVEDFSLLIWFFMVLGAVFFIWGILEEVKRLLKRNKEAI